MAPELFQGSGADAKSDQYGLACLLYRMLAGRTPFTGSRDVIMHAALGEDVAPALELLAPDIAPTVCIAVNRALSRDPESRFASVDDFVDACEIPASQSVDELTLRLTPSAVGKSLFGFSPDRDERAAHIVMETFLTMWANDFKRPETATVYGPKRRNGIVRSLALHDNFFDGMQDELPTGMRLTELGDRLSSGEDFLGSEGLALAQSAMQSLVDRSTVQGSNGATLMLPFHESLLWFDARRSGKSTPWSVRKVNMRGTGVSIARMLLDPGAPSSDATKTDAAVALAGIRDALRSPSPLGVLADRLRAVVSAEEERKPLEADEVLLWDVAGTKDLSRLGERVARHVSKIVGQPNVPAPTKLLQVRSVIALDILTHMLTCGWEKAGLPEESRFLVLSYSPEERRSNRVRIASEECFEQSRLQISRAIRVQIAETIETLQGTLSTKEAWALQFEKRGASIRWSRHCQMEILVAMSLLQRFLRRVRAMDTVVR